jgi:Spy/CpxP family protein refolding chaperone
MPVFYISVKIVAAAVLIVGSTSSARAVTCEDVRSLTRAEQDYWSKRLNLTREQRHQIWQACYGKFRSGRPHIRVSNSAE